jgi:hypothetical protein
MPNLGMNRSLSDSIRCGNPLKAVGEPEGPSVEPNSNWWEFHTLVHQLGVLIHDGVVEMNSPLGIAISPDPTEIKNLDSLQSSAGSHEPEPLAEDVDRQKYILHC